MTLPPALILAAGLGTRLRPLTNRRAKAALPVAGTPLICRLLRRLVSEGVRDVVINLHHQPDTITAVVGAGEAHGCRVRYSWETTVLGTAGGPRHALPLLGSRFFIVNGDTLSRVNLRELLDKHRRENAGVTMAVTTNPAPKRYGGVLVDDKQKATGFCQPGTRNDSRLFVGVQVAEARVFSSLPDGVPAASIGGCYGHLLEMRRITVHHGDGVFHDIGTPADYIAADRAVAAEEGKTWPRAGARTVVHPTASVERSILWDDVDVGPNCTITDCVVADGVRLPKDTVLHRQLIIPTSNRPISGAIQIGDAMAIPLTIRR
ncbi:MAG: sugar phosphate nucleotidyltransferase [Acidobacteriota bacterium]|nr:sugar phosphate nucleotidyltransferase [Acidobacteriota bacterium]